MLRQHLAYDVGRPGQSLSGFLPRRLQFGDAREIGLRSRDVAGKGLDLSR